MDQNLLYMFEFVIDDLLITHPNECAPEEYPTCVELTFRSSIFVQIYDSDFDCSNTDSYYTSKGGKCCLFSLNSQITENDKLHIHVYKKKVEKCKFLLGAAEISLKNMFDRVTNEFRQINTSFEKKSDETMKQEEYCPSSEIEKKLLSLIDSQTGRQTGNMVIIIRLSCMGPTIVSPFPFRKGCGRSSGGGETNDDELNRARGGENNIAACSPTKIPYLYKMKSHNMTKPKNHQNNTNNNNREYISSRLTAGANNIDSSDKEDILNKERKSAGKQYYKNKVNEYDEFEADMNCSGLSIRVLKNHFQVNVQDSDYESDDDGRNYRYCTSNPEFQESRFLNNQLRSQTGEYFNNRRCLPKILGTLKYSGNKICQEKNNFELPIPVIRENRIRNKIDKYRKYCPITHCRCIQVQPDEIEDTLTNINRKTKKDGIEVCHKKCFNEDVDIFLFKLGKKKKSKDKQHLIEIELKTPKVPIVLQKQLVSQHTQIDEIELDSELQNICLKKRSKKNERSK